MEVFSDRGIQVRKGYQVVIFWLLLLFIFYYLFAQFVLVRSMWPVKNNLNEIRVYPSIYTRNGHDCEKVQNVHQLCVRVYVYNKLNTTLLHQNRIYIKQHSMFLEGDA